MRRPYWRCYYANTQVSRWRGRSWRTPSSDHVSYSQAIIYVIDSSDVARLPTSRSELLTMLSEDELKHVPVLVFANKQACPSLRLVIVTRQLTRFRFRRLNRTSRAPSPPRRSRTSSVSQVEKKAGNGPSGEVARSRVKDWRKGSIG